MRRNFILLGLAGPVLLAACARQPEPEPAVMVSPGEEACVAQAAVASGLEAETITATPVAATKTGATVYDVVAGEQTFTCTVETDQTISGFAPA